MVASEAHIADNRRRRTVMKKEIFPALILSAAMIVTALLSPASGKGRDVKQIPNGKKFACAQCHGGSYKTADLTSFGRDYKANGFMWNASLAKKDSDGDGKTNGQELGDPAGVWTKGADNPAGAVSNPGDGACG